MSIKGLMMRFGPPITAGGALFAALYFAESGDWISPTVAFWLWPSLIALILLAGSVIALL